MRGALHWAPIGNEPNRVGRIFEFSLSCNSDVTITQILDIGTGTGREILSHRCGVTQVWSWGKSGLLQYLLQVYGSLIWRSMSNCPTTPYLSFILLNLWANNKTPTRKYPNSTIIGTDVLNIQPVVSFRTHSLKKNNRAKHYCSAPFSAVRPRINSESTHIYTLSYYS